MKRFSLLLLPLVVLLFLGAGCFTTTVNVPAANSDENATATIDVPLTITKGAENQKEYTVSVEQGTTALALLQKASDEQHFVVGTKTYDFGDLVESIDGLAADNTHYWSFFVNGSPASVGAGEYKLQPGDRVAFSYQET